MALNNLVILKTFILVSALSAVVNGKCIENLEKNEASECENLYKGVYLQKKSFLLL